MQDRIEKIRNLMANEKLDAIALNPGPTLSYLTGLSFHLSERPTVVLITDKNLTIILPRLEAGKLASIASNLKPFFYGDDPQEWQGVFDQAVRQTGVNARHIGVEPAQIRFLELNYLQNASPDSRLVGSGSLFARLRMRKDDAEIASMRKAAIIAQDALLCTLGSLRLGMSEAEIAAELTVQLLRHGSDPDLPFQPIVGSGPNSANPHAIPTDRPLRSGDLLLFDWGARADGYCSDITRTFAINHLSGQLAEVYRTVERANAAGREASRAGVPAGDVDAATRAVTQTAKMDQFFTHRTGHGLGLEMHEDPYIFAGNPLLLEEGMTYTIEPGIYLPDVGGVRIEDNVAVRADGTDVIINLPRELRILEII